jgi:hypothetical protein
MLQTLNLQTQMVCAEVCLCRKTRNFFYHNSVTYVCYRLSSYEKITTLMMEAVRTSETSVDNHFTRQYNPEDSSEHHTRRRENLKSHNVTSDTWTFNHINNLLNSLHVLI